jgi:hypothetical protein
MRRILKKVFEKKNEKNSTPFRRGGGDIVISIHIQALRFQPISGEKIEIKTRW